MITHRVIAKRFKDGRSVEWLARSIPFSMRKQGRHFDAYEYIEHAIRQIMRKQRKPS